MRAHGLDQEQPTMCPEEITDDKRDDDRHDPPVIDTGKIRFQFVHQATLLIRDPFEGTVSDIGSVLASVDQKQDENTYACKEDKL